MQPEPVARVREPWVLVATAPAAAVVALPQAGWSVWKEPHHRLATLVLTSNIRDENINDVPFLSF